VRLDHLIRQVVLGDDDAGAVAAHARRGLEFVALLALAAVDAGEKLH
jgi:hypothetical protein